MGMWTVDVSLAINVSVWCEAVDGCGPVRLMERCWSVGNDLSHEFVSRDGVACTILACTT
jgi:hypothetical protein